MWYSLVFSAFYDIIKLNYFALKCKSYRKPCHPQKSTDERIMIMETRNRSSYPDSPHPCHGHSIDWIAKPYSILNLAADVEQII
jgi:hypothetical protein